MVIMSGLEGGTMTLRELLNIIKNLLIRPEEPVFPEELPCEELLELAHQELAAAETIFAENDDPDMIDFTVYNLKTAEARYSYLLHKLREKAGEESWDELDTAGVCMDPCPYEMM
jgi:hypothetical protein